MMETTRLSGWGRTAPVNARLHRSTSDELCERIGRSALTWVPRGMGRAYGDAAVLAGGNVVSLTDNRLAIDVENEWAICSADVTIDQVIEAAVPRGFFVPVTPGTRMVSIGGAVAADIHGKNHHHDGSFGDHVRWLRLLDGRGQVRELRPGTREFDATVGGMGLTGVIIEVCFSLIPIRSPWMTVDTYRVNELDELMSLMRELDAIRRYSVAWIDVMSTGSSLGRGVLTAGDHIADYEPLEYHSPQVIPVGHALPPVNMVNRVTAAAFNELWWRKAPRQRLEERQSIPHFFHPLDGVGAWNRLYGPAGFIQHQFCVPDGAEDVLREVVGVWSSSRMPSSLNVLKRFGPGSVRPLSFPMAGWTLTVDVPAKGGERLRTTLERIDHLVLDGGGRHYLAKDSYLRPGSIRRGYPRLREWRQVRDEMDPDGRWTSDLARRLGLVGAPMHVEGLS